MEQLAAHEAIEQAKHEDMLVTCLMRQSQLERRIALQLLQVRLEKDVIRNNRLVYIWYRTNTILSINFT